MVESSVHGTMEAMGTMAVLTVNDTVEDLLDQEMPVRPLPTTLATGAGPMALGGHATLAFHPVLLKVLYKIVAT